MSAKLLRFVRAREIPLVLEVLMRRSKRRLTPPTPGHEKGIRDFPQGRAFEEKNHIF
jgi:hypothetical protein